MALELQSNQLVFSFPEIHEGAKLTIEFQRTLRLPDDGKTYPLPPGMGRFPVRHTDNYLDRLPPQWKEHGGVFLPLYQAEALWINFHPHTPSRHASSYPFIVKVATGRKSALTGKEWRKGIHKGDYCVIPQQNWLDGYVIEEGMIAQFVAVPLGQDLTVEEQLGGDGIGGIQIEVYPMKADCFERRWPKQPPPSPRLGGMEGRQGGLLRSRKSVSKSTSGPIGPCGMGSYGPPGVYTTTAGPSAADAPVACAADCDDSRDANLDYAPDMGIGAGGRMKQQVFEDPYGKDEWCRGAIKSTRRCFVHLANSMAWQNITDERPPETPVTAAAYERQGYPWFDFYSDDAQALKGGKLFQGIKSVKDKAAEKGLKGVLPENQSVKPKNVKPILGVRNGSW
jgi:hypothetical protein